MTAPVGQARRAIEAARTLADHLDRFGREPAHEPGDTLLVRNLTVVMTGDDVLEVLPAVTAAVEAGHSCSLELEDDGNLDIVWRADADPDVVGDQDFLIDPVEQTQLRRFMTAGDAVGTVETLRDRTFVFRTSLRFRESGLAWIPSHELLVDSLASGAWLSTLLQLSQSAAEGHAILLVDGLDQQVQTHGFTFVPTDQISSLPSVPTAGDRVEEGELFRSVRIERGWPQVPSPTAMTPDPDPGGGLASTLVSVAHALAWMWLSADPPIITPTSVVTRYRGVRDIELALTPQPGIHREELDQAVALWRWMAAGGDDPVRTDATQRAISLAAAQPADLRGAAGPALRTARTLHDLATSGAIAEALAARRAGRDAAAAAANAAATTSREAAGKATERSLALMVAAAAVVFATVQEVLEWYVSAAALVALALLLIGSLVVARTVDLAAADHALDSFDEDVDDYRESLSVDDLQQIKQLAVLRSARRHVARARRAATWVYMTCSIVATGLALLLACPNIS